MFLAYLMPPRTQSNQRSVNYVIIINKLDGPRSTFDGVLKSLNPLQIMEQNCIAGKA